MLHKCDQTPDTCNIPEWPQANYVDLGELLNVRPEPQEPLLAPPKIGHILKDQIFRIR